MATKSTCIIILVATICSLVHGQGQFHSSDQIGNFKVAYTASGGHYLVEDRSADGTSLLGNFGYQSRDGEQVGVAYGSDGAGFVIRGPGATSSSSGGGSSSSGARSSSSSISYNSVYDQDPYQRYQQVNYPSSNPALSSSVSSYSSLPASDFSSLYSTQTTSGSSAYPQQSDQSFLSATSQSAASSQTYTQPISYYNSAPSHSAYQSYHTPTPSTIYRQPFSYSFSSYNDPYAPRYTPPPTPAPALQVYAPTAPVATTPVAAPSPQSNLDHLFQQLRVQQQSWTPSPIRAQTAAPQASNYGYSTGSAFRIPFVRSWITPFIV